VATPGAESAVSSCILLSYASNHGDILR